MIGFFKRPLTAIVFDDITVLENSIAITHTFPGVTKDIPFYVDGEQARGLLYNPVDGKHYGVAVVASDSTYLVETTDETGTAVFVNATTNAAPVKPTPVRTRYVTPGGTGDYSIGDPGSLTSAASDEQANDQIIMEPGVYHEGDLSFSQPVILEAKDSGDKPVISGFRPTQPSSWTDEGAGEYSTTDFDTNVKMVCWLETGLNQQLAPKVDRATLQADAHGWTVVGSTLYIKLPGSLDPNSQTVKIPSTFQNGIAFWNPVWLENIVFEGYGAGSSSINNRAVLFKTGSAGSVATGVVVRDNHTDSIRVESDDNIIDGCSFLMNRDYMRWTQDIKNDPPDAWKSEGACDIVVIGSDRLIVRNCTFDGNADGINIPDIGSSSHIDIHDNTFTNVMDETIAINGTHSHIRRWNNVLDRTHYWIGYATAKGGPYFFFNERCPDTGYILALDQLTVYAFELRMTKYNFSPGTIGMHVAHHCTVDLTFGNAVDYKGSQGVFIPSGYVSPRFIAKNNIFVGRGTMFWDDNAVGGSFEFDSNLWWTTDEYSEYPTFAAFQSGSGQEANGEFTDPSLSGGIPAAPHAGKFIPGITGNSLIGVSLPNKGAE
jgi:hypothetical protein